MKKIAIIGRGTAGCYAASHFLRWTDWEIDWYFDPKISPQAVGEGSTLDFPKDLDLNLGFNVSELESIYGTAKAGIKKVNWGPGKEFVHTFPGGHVGYHFNAVLLQEWIISKLKTNRRVAFFEKNVTADVVDADYVMDCSGKPSNFDKFTMSEYIPVNSVHVTQCFWEGVKFQYTLTIARPYGWVFGIPLLNRCSIGYMYNNNINTLEEVKEDVKQIFKDYNLTPSDTTNSFSFKNYYRNVNYEGRVAYNGNTSFFLEPLEATSINFMNRNQRRAFDYWHFNKSLEETNKEYSDEIKEIENVIMLHYAAGSIYETKFWEEAQQRGYKNFLSLLMNPRFREILNTPDESMHYGTWNKRSFHQNLPALDLFNKIL
jgi:hypothetical protein